MALQGLILYFFLIGKIDTDLKHAAWLGNVSAVKTMLVSYLPPIFRSTSLLYTIYYLIVLYIIAFGMVENGFSVTHEKAFSIISDVLLLFNWF